MSRDPEILDLGREPFATTHRRMLEHAEALRKREVRGKILLVEHPPIYTAGRATPADDLGGDVISVERGGKITFHGPGQLVIYPIVRLPKHDVRAWLRTLESFGIAICRALDLEGEPSVDGTGVFVNNRKLMSIGVAIRHWINLHGISVNVDMNLAAFHRIRPCGLDPSVMSDLSRALGRTVSLAEVAGIVRHLAPMLCAPEVEARPR